MHAAQTRHDCWMRTEGIIALFSQHLHSKQHLKHPLTSHQHLRCPLLFELIWEITYQKNQSTFWTGCLVCLSGHLLNPEWCARCMPAHSQLRLRSQHQVPSILHCTWMSALRFSMHKGYKPCFRGEEEVSCLTCMYAEGLFCPGRVQRTELKLLSHQRCWINLPPLTLSLSRSLAVCSPTLPAFPSCSFFPVTHCVFSICLFLPTSVPSLDLLLLMLSLYIYMYILYGYIAIGGYNLIKSF